MQSYCTLCYGKQELTFAHISSMAHRHWVNRLPAFFWLMTDKEIYQYIRTHDADDKQIRSKKKKVRA
jgi:hypothetical protein